MAERPKERRQAVAEQEEIRASHEEVEEFVRQLQGFYGSLSVGGRAMLVTILEGAQAKDTGGYGFRFKRYEDPEGQQGGSEEGGTSSVEGWNDLIGWIEEQGEEDTQGFAYRYR
jgi:hypothetical protein